MELTVKLQVFEGPLDLLLHLLEKNKVNIYDIPIVEITNQYMEYIAEMRRQDLNVILGKRNIWSQNGVPAARIKRSYGLICSLLRNPMPALIILFCMSLHI